ncbi:MAG: gamma-glutamyltransferase, partial [Rhodospirillaceae bacterium]|nr:gamma-glutamyltransferase [Rhodospirillaceae bacterium]
MVLNLVEPQSSGIGGGGFLMHFNAKNGDLAAYDGRETAPASATPDMFLNTDGQPLAFFDAVVGGLSVGVPGALRMLEAAHKEHGLLPWAKLFEDAIRLAEGGFTVSERLHKLVAGDRYLKRHRTTAAYFYDDTGAPWPVGHILKNPELAATLRQIATGGADAFYQGPIAQAMVDTVSHGIGNPGGLSLADLSAYKTIKREPACLFYRKWLVCGFGPPSSGGLTTLQILGMLQSFDLGSMKPGKDGLPDVRAVHLISEAARLAFADRNAFIADEDFVAVPSAGMLDPGYLERRAAEISTSRSIGRAAPGTPGGKTSQFAPGTSSLGLSTTHMSIVDANGNAVSMTTSIENAFGSRMMVGGFLLNNQLTDFNFRPTVDGRPVANAAAPGKRPRSSMSPTLVFDNQGRVVLAIGSPGGSRIIGYVVKTLIATLDWEMDIQQAIDMPNFTNRNTPTDLEQGTAIETLADKLKALGQEIRTRPMTSGLHGIHIVDGVLFGGADQRREGVALGD